MQYVIIGHSERRQYFGETDETVAQRVRAALDSGLEVILCVGETLEQREADITGETIAIQVKKALAGDCRGAAAHHYCVRADGPSAPARRRPTSRPMRSTI